MSISSPFIHRPIATTLLSIGVALIGILAFNLMPIAKGRGGNKRKKGKAMGSTNKRELLIKDTE